ncbi:MAG: PKD domain-containing protein, partial [Clostridiaceae bacterium]|nr:PKD domain-containing protein [Clostridiaceae bacterium]
ENHDPSENWVAIFNWTETDRFENFSYIDFDPYYCFNIVGYDTFYGQELKQITLGGKDKMDLSIIKTDRIPAPKIDFQYSPIPLNIYNGRNVKQYLVGKELFMIGHSMGLPLVLTDNAFINNEITFNDAKKMGITNLVDHTKELTQNQFDRLCFADLDGFAGNSGSPVFVKDRANCWSIVGIFTGGPDDYGSNSLLYIIEHKYTKEEYERGEKFERFQILEGMPRFKKHCDTDCNYINIVKNSDIQVKKPVESGGDYITVTLPTGSKFRNDVYFVSFRGATGGFPDISTILKEGLAKKVFYNSGGLPMCGRKITMWIQNGFSYNIVMVNKNGTLVHDFNKSGKAGKSSLKTGNSVATIIDDTPNVLRFVPDFNLGESPLIVNFDAYIPNIDDVVSCLWEFGDGNTSDAMYPSHTYKKAGIYDVKLTVNYTSIMGPYTNHITYDNCVEVLATRRLLILDGDIKKYPVFGIENVKINDRVACKDVNDIMMPVACNGKIEIGRSGECGDLICRGDVFLRDYAT